MGVGLDIGTKYIKIVELSKKGKNLELRGSGIVAHKEKPIKDTLDDKELGNLATIVKKLFKEAKISKREVNISLPETQVFTRVVSFPYLTDQEIASAVKWEAEQYIPIPVAEAIVKHKIIERDEKTTPPSVKVLLIAAPVGVADKYVSVAQKANLNVVAVETELMSLVRALAPPQQTAVVVDFGAVSTDIAISKNKNLVFSRSVTTAGNAFTRAIAQGMGIEQIQAEEYKKTYGLSTDKLEGKVASCLDPVVRVVVDEIKKAIHFHQTEAKSEVPNSIIVSGGSVGLPNVTAILTKLLGIEVVVANPFTNIIVSESAKKQLASYAPIYSVAVGLAQRS